MLKSLLNVWDSVWKIEYYVKYILYIYSRILKRYEESPYLTSKTVHLTLLTWNTPYLNKGDTVINRTEEAISFLIRLQMLSMTKAEKEHFKKLLLRPKYSKKYELSFNKIFNKIDARQQSLAQIQTSLNQINEWHMKKQPADMNYVTWQETFISGLYDCTETIKAILKENSDWINEFAFIMQEHDSIADGIINLRLLSFEKIKNIEDKCYFIIP